MGWKGRIGSSIDGNTIYERWSRDISKRKGNKHYEESRSRRDERHNRERKNKLKGRWKQPGRPNYSQWRRTARRVNCQCWTSLKNVQKQLMQHNNNNRSKTTTLPTSVIKAWGKLSVYARSLLLPKHHHNTHKIMVNAGKKDLYTRVIRADYWFWRGPTTTTRRPHSTHHLPTTYTPTPIPEGRVVHCDGEVRHTQSPSHWSPCGVHYGVMTVTKTSSSLHLHHQHHNFTTTNTNTSQRYL